MADERGAATVELPLSAPATEPDPTASARLVWRIATEYRELPGMSLTLPQATRLLGADRQACLAALHALVARGDLAYGNDGRYRAASTLPGTRDDEIRIVNTGGHIMRDVFSRTGMAAVGLMLLSVMGWAVWMLAPTALNRWFG